MYKLAFASGVRFFQRLVIAFACRRCRLSVRCLLFRVLRYGVACQRAASEGDAVDHGYCSDRSTRSRLSTSVPWRCYACYDEVSDVVYAVGRALYIHTVA